MPAIAPEFHPAQKPLPELGRVGVDMDRQRPLSLREALALALENNKDIEVARHNVKIAEFDLTVRARCLRSAPQHIFLLRTHQQSDFEFSQRRIEWHYHFERLHRNCPTRRTITEVWRKLSPGFLIHPPDYQQSVCAAESTISDGLDA